MATLTKQRQVVKFFRIVFQIGEDVYNVVPLRPDPEVAVKAYRLRKQTGGQEVYDVRIDPQGYGHCECLGFLRWNKPCKHLRTLHAAGMITLPRHQLHPEEAKGVPA